MKRICCLLSCLLSVVICCTILISCSSVTTNEELTEAEKKFAGEWELEDITYFTSNYNPTTEQFERIQLWYPSSSSTFNSLCEQYLYKTTLSFDNNKVEGRISAKLKVDNTVTEFSWWGDESSSMINFSQSLRLSIYDDGSIKSGLVSYAMINSNGKLCLNPDLTMIYIFSKV